MESPEYNVLLVGQIYLDTILNVPHFPEEDHKLRATRMEQRRGGNTANTAEILAQFPTIKPWCMSALGPKITTKSLIHEMEDASINTSTCLFRNEPTPSSYIIQSNATGSRTIISSTTIDDITVEEFAKAIEAKMMTLPDRMPPFTWIHFEGRNIDQVVQQIDWLDSKAITEGWRDQLVISVELEKPDREHIDWLMPKGDVVFFSKLFAERRGYDNAATFLHDIKAQCKAKAIIYCTWGSHGATCLSPDNTLHHAPAIKTERVIDAIGAGDTFIAGIIFSLSRNMSLSLSLKFACELASRKVAQQGFSGLAQQAMVTVPDDDGGDDNDTNNNNNNNQGHSI